MQPKQLESTAANGSHKEATCWGSQSSQWLIQRQVGRRWGGAKSTSLCLSAHYSPEDGGQTWGLAGRSGTGAPWGGLCASGGHTEDRWMGEQGPTVGPGHQRPVAARRRESSLVGGWEGGEPRFSARWVHHAPACSPFDLQAPGWRWEGNLRLFQAASCVEAGDGKCQGFGKY